MNPPFPLRVRQSARVLGLSLILLEVLYTIIYLSLFALLTLGTLHLPKQTISITTTLFLIVFVILTISKISFTLFLFLHWLSCNYEIRKGEISYTEGLIARKEKFFNLVHIEDIVISQSFWGRIFKFGTIRLLNPVMNKKFYLYSIPQPEYYAKVIRQAIKDAPKDTSKVSIFREDAGVAS